MKVEELIELLGHADPTAEVLVAKDPEGNGFNPLHEVVSTPVRDGEPCHPDDADTDAKEVLVLWP